MKRAVKISLIVLGCVIALPTALVCYAVVATVFQQVKLASIVGPMRTEDEWKHFAENGDQIAQSEQCSAHGFKNDVDPYYYQKIISWCRNDAEKGDVSGETLLAKLYAAGQSGFRQNWEEAYFWRSVSITDSHIPTTERDEARRHLTSHQIKLIDEKTVNWKAKLCASNPTERNAKVMREWHCGAGG